MLSHLQTWRSLLWAAGVRWALCSLILTGCAAKQKPQSNPWTECHAVAFDTKAKIETFICHARNGDTFQVQVHKLN